MIFLKSLYIVSLAFATYTSHWSCSPFQLSIDSLWRLFMKKSVLASQWYLHILSLPTVKNSICTKPNGCVCEVREENKLSRYVLKYWREKIIICWWDQAIICPYAAYMGTENRFLSGLVASLSKTQSFLGHLDTLNNPYAVTEPFPLHSKATYEVTWMFLAFLCGWFFFMVLK